jgi:hypothetical protein
MPSDMPQPGGRPVTRARESLEAKAARLLAAGALTVLEVGPAVIRAHCQGDSGRAWRLGWYRGRWGCQCPAGQFGGACAHLRALRLVVAEPAPEDADAGPGLTRARLRREQAEATRVRAGNSRRTA